MLDYIHLSQTTPCNEPCAQVGEENYMTNARIEAHVYLDQLRRTFGEILKGLSLKWCDARMTLAPISTSGFIMTTKTSSTSAILVTLNPDVKRGTPKPF